MVDLHSAVRTAVDEARRLAASADLGISAYAGKDWYSAGGLADPHHKGGAGLNDEDAAFIAAWSPARALAMCDWADDVLRRHVGEPFMSYEVCKCCHLTWPCAATWTRRRTSSPPC